METTLQALVERIRAAAADRTALRIRGSGSKDFYGQHLMGEVLDTRCLQGIVAYEPSELVVTVRTGTSLRELQETLAQKNQWLAFEPPHFGAEATVGGMLCSGLAGPARANTGSVRDYVLGLHLINAQAQVLEFGAPVMKNVAGYDVSRLLAGSLGTLGLVTQVCLKVMPQPKAQSTLRFEYDAARALQALNRWSGLPLPLSASCWHAGVLHVRLSGAHAAVQTAQRELGGELIPEEPAHLLWESLREQTHPFFTSHAPRHAALWRVSVPDVCPKGNAPHDTLIEWHGAQRWVWASLQEGALLRQQAVQAGGHATVFRHPLDLPEHPALAVFTPLDAVTDRIQQALKKEFDPAGIFSRERLYPHW